MVKRKYKIRDLGLLSRIRSVNFLTGYEMAHPVLQRWARECKTKPSELMVYKQITAGVVSL